MMKKQNKIYLGIGFFAIIVLGIFLAGCVQKGEETIKIRFTGPLSGAYAYYGQEAQRGLELAFQNNKDLLSKKGLSLDIKYEDNTGDKTKSVTDFNLFMSEGDVPLVISTNTPLSQPLIPLAESNKVNLLVLISGAKDLAKDKNYAFRDAIMSFDEGALLGQYFSSHGLNKIATLVVNDDYGLSCVLGVKNEIEPKGGKVVAEEVFENSAKDVRSQISKIKEANPDAVLLVGREANAVIAAQQMIELGIPQEKIYSIDSFESPNVLKGLGELAESVKITSVYYDLSDEKTKIFFEQFNKVYGVDPGIYAIDAYSAGEYIIQSIAECGTSAEKINDCLKTKTFTTIKGDISFNEKHDMKVTVGLFEIKSGKKELIEKLK